MRVIKNNINTLRLLLYFSISLSSCVENKSDKNDSEKVRDKCVCDSIGTFKNNGKVTTYAYIHKSQIEIKEHQNNDTIEVTRYYTEDNMWHVQEYLRIVNNKIVDPKYSIYCDFSDSLNNYKLTFVRDTNYQNPEIKIDKFLNTEVKIGEIVYSSKSNILLIPKDKFKGKIEFSRKLIGLSKGERGYVTQKIVLTAESLIKYGNLLGQYKAIKKTCLQ